MTNGVGFVLLLPLKQQRHERNGQRNLMFSIPRLKYFAISILICLLIVKALSLLTYQLFKPTFTNDLQAYQLLCQGTQSPELADLQIYSTQAAQLATDADLKKLADFTSRVSAAVLNNGATKKSETTSMTGFIKLVSSMGINPSALLNSASLTIEGLLIDYDKIGREVDARYQPLLKKDVDAKVWSIGVFWYGLLFGLYVVWHQRPLPQTQVAKPKSPTESTAELIQCPSCGSRNRNHPLAAGQKLVCGQCKTVLLSV